MKAIIVLAWVSLSLSSSVSAQQPISDSQDFEARRLFEAGEVAFADGRFENALQRFREAYELSPRPRLLFNIGTAAERVRHDDEALAAYRAYLDAMPDATNREQVRARIQIIEQSQTDRTVRESETTETEEDNHVLTWILAGTSVVLTAAGVVARLLGDAAYDELLDRCTASSGCTQPEIDASSVKTWDGLMVTSFVLAGAAAVGMVLSLVVSGDDDETLAIRLSPQGIVLSGSF